MTAATPTPVAQDPDLTRPLLDLAAELFPPDQLDLWLDGLNPHLGLRTPRSYIGQPDEFLVRDMLRAAKSGAFS
jgi:hypothetical protein